MTDWHDRDYSESFSVELEWWEWNHIFSNYCEGCDKKETDGWPDDELERDRDLRGKLASKIGEASPGNGVGDWPDSVKRAYDETVQEMLNGAE